MQEKIFCAMSHNSRVFTLGSAASSSFVGSISMLRRPDAARDFDRALRVDVIGLIILGLLNAFGCVFISHTKGARISQI